MENMENMKEFKVQRLAMIQQTVYIMALDGEDAKAEAARLLDFEWEDVYESDAPVEGSIEILDSEEVL